MDQIPADGGCGWENADGKMRMEKKMQITKRVRRKKTRNVDGKKKKINKQTIKERNLSFKSLSDS